MTAGLPLALIVAVARNGVIGADNALPWRLPGDMRHFKAVTMGKPVLMGRKTYQSIGRPLPGRPVIVLSRDPAFRPPGVLVTDTAEAALHHATAAGHAAGATEIMVAGGGALYRMLIGQAERLYVTAIEADPIGDTTFPPIDPRVWREVERTTPPRTAADEAVFTFVTYERFASGFDVQRQTGEKAAAVALSPRPTHVGDGAGSAGASIED